jgi:hypothetical protein
MPLSVIEVELILESVCPAPAGCVMGFMRTVRGQQCPHLGRMLYG